MDARRRDAVAAYIVLEKITRDGKRHGDHGAFAGGVGEAIGNAGGAGDGGHVEDDAAARIAHVTHDGFGGVEITVDVDAHDAVEIAGAGAFDGADVGHADVVDEDIEAALGDQGAENFRGAGFVGEIAGLGRCLAAGGHDFGSGGFGAGAIEIEDVDRSAGCGEGFGNGKTDAAGSASDNRSLIIEPKGG